MNEVTRILSDLANGKGHAAERLLPLVYDELRRLAAAQMAREKPGQTLDATALVHEAYLRLVDAKPQAASWDGRAHFFAAAAEAMRRILVENARRKKRLKHGGGRRRVPLEDVAAEAPPDDLLALDEALTQFAEEDPVKARLVQLRFFAGLSIEDAAECLGLSRATAVRHWTYARAWLYEKVRSGEKDENP